MLNYDFRKTSRKCSETGREFEPGEEFISALLEFESGETERRDFSLEAWKVPPENCIGWWKTKLPLLEKGKIHWAPRDVLLAYFEHLQKSGDSEASLYVMALLLVQKHILRLVETVSEEDGQWLRLRRSADKSNYRIKVVALNTEQGAKIQEELGEKLFTSFRDTDEESED